MTRDGDDVIVFLPVIGVIPVVVMAADMCEAVELSSVIYLYRVKLLHFAHCNKNTVE